MRVALLALLVVAGCAGKTPAPRAVAATKAAACASPEHRQLDFWIGDWDLVVRAREAPGVDRWREARGQQRIEPILGGCVIAEHFTADGPKVPWAGKSHSIWQPRLGKWRQTWVDDQGSYLTFTGGLEEGTMALYGEPFERDGQRVQMRMVFLEVTRDALRWEWQASTDGGATWSPNLVILYRRR